MKREKSWPMGVKRQNRQSVTELRIETPPIDPRNKPEDSKQNRKTVQSSTKKQKLEDAIKNYEAIKTELKV